MDGRREPQVWVTDPGGLGFAFSITPTGLLTHSDFTLGHTEAPGCQGPLGMSVIRSS